ncbi:hypothetical protein PR202_ga07801 [Eleusine coracana subsp. coracana]|uniref:Uncharacterized protein n=1 Tax=Eleusine coracana subsp. coracana TaxID=191504 RepID=A0AAV5C0I9_ELECO|nr:hypothetical protein PR202_ga07801 [Eleusine coracana subsp. coracana]
MHATVIDANHSLLGHAKSGEKMHEDLNEEIKFACDRRLKQRESLAPPPMLVLSVSGDPLSSRSSDVELFVVVVVNPHTSSGPVPQAASSASIVPGATLPWLAHTTRARFLRASSSSSSCAACSFLAHGTSASIPSPSRQGVVGSGGGAA